MDLDQVKRAVVRVGAGRGFVVRGEDGYDTFVITAAHCLPRLPVCCASSSREDRTYPNLLAPLGQEPSVLAECLFADPISDLAVLGSPDNQALSDEADAYETLMEPLLSVSISDTPMDRTVQAWLLSLDNQWFRCELNHNGGLLWISDPAKEVVGGMSGSPIINDAGAAVGIVSNSSDDPGTVLANCIGARLVHNLPAGILQALGASFGVAKSAADPEQTF